MKPAAAKQEPSSRKLAASAVGNKRLSEGERCEAPTGVLAKGRMVAQPVLGGPALWRIGTETPAFWPALEGRWRA